jgi:hypothetical protein
VLWYLTNDIGHCGMTLQEVAGYSTAGATVRTFNDLQPQNALFHGPADPSHVRSRLLQLGGSISALIRRQRSAGVVEGFAAQLTDVFGQLVSASNDAQIDLGQAAVENLFKALARWPLRRHFPPLVDATEDPTEQLPRLMRARFEERRVDGRLRVVLTMNDVEIGDPLTDNRAQEDDYRFHDVFHLAFAGILGWSPVLRTLLNVRRSSQPAINENQDGARAKITEEGISNWIFAYGLRHQAFEHVDSVDFDLLKTIGEMVKGYEVEQLPPWTWEHAILEAFRIFRFLRQHRGGLVAIDLNNRSLMVAASEDEPGTGLAAAA